ncbi:hypothetical protein [Martelella sp. HB161492]|uniref:hypothetical protein n=1 Tax=Martelella sp. HB161492 TaxID=2720726 RepID=UPI0015905682|nr:hypothetical protein [Martelella sp. HB161492]
MTSATRLKLVFRDTGRMVTANMMSMIVLLWPFAALGLLEYALLVMVMENGTLAGIFRSHPEFFAILFRLFPFVHLLLAASAAVALHRCLLRNERPGWTGLHFGMREFIYWLVLLAIYSLGLAFDLGRTSAMKFVDGLTVADQLSGWYPALFEALGVVLCLVIAPLGLRLALILPAIATDRQISYLLNLRMKDLHAWYCHFGRGFGLPMAMSGLVLIVLFQASEPLFHHGAVLAFRLTDSLERHGVPSILAAQLKALMPALQYAFDALLFLFVVTIISATYRIALRQIGNRDNLCQSQTAD